jgi:putative DNA primase/helicase
MVETEDGQRLAESRLKQMTGGDAMTARVLYGSLFDFTPVLKLWLSDNHKPVIRGDDYGIWRRIVLVPFEVVLPKESRDKNLPEKLRLEFPGILNWLLRGCLMWQKNGLRIPPEVTAQVEQYKSSMDLLAQWLEDCCVQDTRGQCRARAAYESFAKWCKQGGHNPISEVRFAQKMSERGYVAEHNRSGKFYLGLTAAQTELAFGLGST